MTTETLETSQREMEAQVNALVTQTKEFKVENDLDLQEADLTLLAIQERMNKVAELMDPVCDTAHKAHKAATEARAKLKTPLEAAKALVTRVRGAYLLAVENRRKAEFAEATRLQKIAQDEADRKQKAEQEALRKLQEDARLETAAKLEAEGKTELAEHVLTMPSPPPLVPAPLPLRPAFVPSAPPTKTSGVVNKKTYRAVFEEDPIAARAQLLTMVKAAAENPDRFLDFLELNVSNIKNYAKRTEGAVAIPGIKVEEEFATSVSARRA